MNMGWTPPICWYFLDLWIHFLEFEGSEGHWLIVLPHPRTPRAPNLQEDGKNQAIVIPAIHHQHFFHSSSQHATGIFQWPHLWILGCQQANEVQGEDGDGSLQKTHGRPGSSKSTEKPQKIRRNWTYQFFRKTQHDTRKNRAEMYPWEKKKIQVLLRSDRFFWRSVLYNNPVTPQQLVTQKSHKKKTSRRLFVNQVTCNSCNVSSDASENQLYPKVSDCKRRSGPSSCSIWATAASISPQWIKFLAKIHIILVVFRHPSEKWWSESQLGWWNSQYDGKVIKFHGSKPPTRICWFHLLSKSAFLHKKARLNLAPQKYCKNRSCWDVNFQYFGAMWHPFSSFWIEP